MPVIASKYALFGVLIVLLLTHTALAEEEDVIANCAQIASVGDRILCLEDALRREAGDPQENEIPVVVTTDAEDISATIDDTIDAEVMVTGDVAITADMTESEQFGLGETRKEPDSPASVDVTIVAVSESAYGKIVFTTGSGQVWQQTDLQNLRYRQIPFEATIRKGASGSHFIQPQNGGVAVRVKRRQ